MKKIELIPMVQLLGKLKSTSVTAEERKGLLETVKVAQYALGVRDEKLKSNAKKFGVEFDPNTGRIAADSSKEAVASLQEAMAKIDQEEFDCQRFLSEQSADSLWQENQLTTAERMMLDELVKTPEESQTESTHK